MPTMQSFEGGMNDQWLFKAVESQGVEKMQGLSPNVGDEPETNFLRVVAVTLQFFMQGFVF